SLGLRGAPRAKIARVRVPVRRGEIRTGYPPPSRRGYQAWRLPVKVTFYSRRGPTFLGLPAGPDEVAVDPWVIPLGSRVYLPKIGWRWARDTGGLVRGNHIDVWMPSRRLADRLGVWHEVATIVTS
ncbi:MAG: 3D domain-containing protein, partial [Candidatus Igneacidithiobacillus chanchocoensis]